MSLMVTPRTTRMLRVSTPLVENVKSARRTPSLKVEK